MIVRKRNGLVMSSDGNRHREEWSDGGQAFGKAEGGTGRQAGASVDQGSRMPFLKVGTTELSMNCMIVRLPTLMSAEIGMPGVR